MKSYASTGWPWDTPTETSFMTLMRLREVVGDGIEICGRYNYRQSVNQKQVLTNDKTKGTLGSVCLWLVSLLVATSCHVDVTNQSMQCS